MKLPLFFTFFPISKKWFFKLRPWLILVILWLSSLLLTAQTNTGFTLKQTIKFRNFTVNQGLSNNNILDIHEDKYGIIWIATEDGLNRFDGYQFKKFFNNPNDFTTISSNYITDIEEDELGNLWIATDNGLNLYNRYLNIFIKFFNKPSDPNTLSNNHIRKLLSESNFLWIETVDGVLNRMNLSNHQVEKHRHSTIYQTYYPYHTILKADSGIWIGGRNLAPHFFNFKTQKFTIVPTGGKTPESKREADVACFYVDSEKRFWVTALDGAYIMSANQKFSKVLPVSTFDVVEDAQKNIWLATGNGLYIFNNELTNFYQFIHTSNNNSLIANHLNCIIKDSKQNIWIGTRDGLSYYSSNTNSVILLKSDEHDPTTISDNYVTALVEDTSRGLVYVATWNGGLNIIDNKNLSCFRIDNKRLLSNRIKSLELDENQNLWIGYWAGLGFGKMNTQTHEIQHYSYNLLNRHTDWYNDFFYQSPDTLWIALWGATGLMHFNPNSRKFTEYHTNYRYILQNLNLKTISAYEDQNYYLYEESGKLLTFNLSNFWLKKVVHLPNLNSNYFLTKELQNDNYENQNFPWKGNLIESRLLSPNKVIYHTSDGLYLKNIKTGQFSILNKGITHSFTLLSKNEIVFFIDNSLEIKCFDCRFQKPTDISEKCKFSKIEAKNHRIAYANNKIYVLKDLILEEYSIDFDNSINIKNHLTIALDSKPIQLIESDSQLLIVNTQGEILSLRASIKKIKTESPNLVICSNIIQNHCLFTDGNAIYKLNINSLEYSKLTPSLPFKIFDFEKLRINYIYLINAHNVLIATNKGPFYYNLSSNQIVPIRYNFTDYAYFAVHLATCVSKNNEDIWVGTTKTGLKRYNLKKQTIQSYQGDILDSSSLWGNTISAIFIDSKKRLWVAATGLNIFNHKTQTFTHHTTDNGLPSNIIHSITEDRKGNLWVSTSKGLCFINTDFEQIRKVIVSSEIPESHFTGSMICLKDGRIMIGTKSGLLVFQPDSLLRIRNNSKVNITEIQIDSRVFGFDSDLNNEIVVPWSNRLISIEFASIDAINDDNIEYEFRLNGFNEKWKTVNSNNRIATFTNLNPGRYTFEVRVKSRELQETQRVTFYIEKPVWQKLWFILIAVFLIISPVLVVIYYRWSKINQQKKALDLEQKLLRSQMNPHFIFNSLGAIQSYILNHNPIDASIYLSKFSELVRQILTNSGSESVSLQQEIATLRNYLELQELRFENKFKYQIKIDANIKPDIIKIPPMLAQPFIENSIEHGFKAIDYQGYIEIDFSISGNELIFSITDNGIGIKASLQTRNVEKTHKSLATIITKSRIRNLKRSTKRNYSIEIIDLQSIDSLTKGTKVIIRLPLI